MLYVLLFAVALYVLYTWSRKKTKNVKTAPAIPKDSQERLANEMVQTILNSLKVEVSAEAGHKEADRAVIDISDEGVRLEPVTTPSLTKYPGVVPYWSHQYVYSHNELKYATDAQKEFYYVFKSSFGKGVYFDVEGNSNYVFILFFDLLNSYDNAHKNLVLLTSQLDVLAECYPRTRSYAKSELLKRLRAKGDEKGIARISDSEIYQPADQTYYYYGLGDRYKKQLKLSEDAVKKLNVLIDTSNKFNGIEYCTIQLINMFLAVTKEVEGALHQNGIDFNEQVNTIAAIELTKHYRYKPGSYNYTSLDKTFINTIYQLIYKCCENKLRDHFSVGRKTDLSSYLHAPNAIAEFNTRFLPYIEKAIEKALQALPKTDLETEVAFNDYNKARWKTIIERLEESFLPENKRAYIDGISELEKCNHKNPSIENIFF